MAQQVGSTSGTASASRATEARATEARATEALEPAGLEPAALEPAALETGMTEAGWPGGTGEAGQPTRAGRVRGWLRRTPPAAAVPTAATAPSIVAAGPDLDLASNDPLVGYLLSAASAVDITGLQLQSPALKALQDAGVVLVVPLISSGSLVGLLSLGPRRSERGYSTDDLRLLNSLAGYAAPAMR